MHKDSSGYHLQKFLETIIAELANSAEVTDAKVDLIYTDRNFSNVDFRSEPINY